MLVSLTWPTNNPNPNPHLKAPSLVDIQLQTVGHIRAANRPAISVGVVIEGVGVVAESEGLYRGGDRGSVWPPTRCSPIMSQS